MKLGVTIVAAALAALLTQQARADDVAHGEAVFKKNCSICHRIGEGAKNFAGPELNGLDGRHSGSVVGFSYTDANKNSGIVWNEESFKKYIRDPRGVIPKTKMVFPGLQKDDEVNDLWAYLKQFDANGKTK